jgi:hypothetical protein
MLMPGNSRPNIFRCDVNYMPMEESQKVHNNSSEIESLHRSLNAVYIDVIKNAETAQIKFPLEASYVRQPVLKKSHDGC